MRNGLLPTYADTVRPEWIDPNGHMNVAYYALTFDHATTGLYDTLGLGFDDIARTDRSVFAVETHFVYLRELREGEPMAFATQLLGHDEKRLHYYHEMIQPEEGVLAATSENIGVHVDMTARRAVAFPEEAKVRIAALMAEHAELPKPKRVGRAISLGLERRT